MHAFFLLFYFFRVCNPLYLLNSCSTQISFSKRYNMIIFGEVDFLPNFSFSQNPPFWILPQKSTFDIPWISWHPFWYKSTHVKVQLGQVLHFIHNLNDSTTIVYCLLEPNVTVLFYGNSLEVHMVKKIWTYINIINIKWKQAGLSGRSTTLE